MSGFILKNIKEINGALAGFLGRFTSRNADYQGYWLIPFLLDLHEPIQIELLAYTEVKGKMADDIRAVATRFAQITLSEQLKFVERTPAELQRASLLITSSSESEQRLAGSHVRECFPMKLKVQVKTNSGREFARDLSLFVAPFDPSLARRSTRWTGNS